MSSEQLDQYDAQSKMFVYNLIVEMGSKVAGRVITKEVVLYLLKRVGVNVAASTVTKYFQSLARWRQPVSASRP